MSFANDRRAALERLLAGLPDVLAHPHELTEPVHASPLVCRRDWDIELRFDHLAIWGNVVIVARLSPTEGSQAAFAEFVEERCRLNDSFQASFGIRASQAYAPHVSLGYFANREGAQIATFSKVAGPPSPQSRSPLASTQPPTPSSES